MTLGAHNGFPSYCRNTAKFLQLQNQGVSAEKAFKLSLEISMNDFTKEVKKYSQINNREGNSVHPGEWVDEVKALLALVEAKKA